MTEIIVDVQFDDTPKEPTFAELQLAKPILKALDKSGYKTPTPIQAGAIPLAMNGRDLLLSAQTGSGKTAAFVLPILNMLATAPKTEPLYHTPPADDEPKGSRRRKKVYHKPAVQAVILTPTRELALQVQNSVRTYGEFLNGIFSVPLVGGSDYRGQIRALTKGVQIIVATPGRFIDHLNSGRIDLSQLKMLVLDEADRMLDMGFSDDINTILDATPADRQTIMSSATWDGAVGKIAESYTNNPERIEIEVKSAHIDESVYYCDDFNHKNKLLNSLIADDTMTQAVIFVATKLSSERLAEQLQSDGHTAHYLHGDLPQGKRNRVVKDIKDKKCRFLIATDVAARGIDIASISHAINYDLPRQAEDYVHRIGRTGRAGRTGVAISLCSRDDRHLLMAIDRYRNQKIKVATIDGLEPRHNLPYEERKGKFGKDKFGKGKGDNHRGRRFGERKERTEFGGFDRFDTTEKPFKKRPSYREDGFEVPALDKPKFDKPKKERSFDDKPRHFKEQGEFKKDGNRQGENRPNSKRFAEFDKKRHFGKEQKGEKSFDKKSPKGFKGGRGVEEFVFHQTGKKRFGDK